MEIPIKESPVSLFSDNPVDFSLTQPAVCDSPVLYDLVETCKPLDVNSRYCYMLIPEHFSSTSIVARAKDTVAGFISAYLVPGRGDTLFVWQVTIHPDFRGQGLGGKMIHGILERSVCSSVSYLETTVTPSNASSRRLFYHLAESLHADVSEKVLFEGKLFGEGAGHEEEILFRIGPFDYKTV